MHRDCWLNSSRSHSKMAKRSKILQLGSGKLATDLKGLGENSVDDARVVKKYLRVVPP